MEGSKPHSKQHHPTYLQLTNELPQILVNIQLVANHKICKAKTLIDNYQQFLLNIAPEQQATWDAVEPKKGRKNVYIPNSVWASKEQLEQQEHYREYGDAIELEEAWKNIQA